MPLLCAIDAPDDSQFLFAYASYAECVLRGYYQSILVLGAVGSLVLFLSVQKLVNYIGARTAATTSRDAHR